MKAIDEFITDGQQLQNIPSTFIVTKYDRDALAKALLRSNGPAWQLFKMLGSHNRCFYSLRWHNLFLGKDDADKRLIYDHKTIAKWKAAVRKFFKPPYFFCIEVGIGREIHVHVVAGYWAGLLKQRRGPHTKIVELIGNSDEDRFCVISYIHKVTVPLTEKHDDITAPLLPDWEERLFDYGQALLEVKRGSVEGFPELRGFVF